jgi:uncharacterized MAPEG superfamily protein
VLPVRGRASGPGLGNFLETSPLFSVVSLAAHVTGTYNALTEWVARLCL